MKKTGLIIFAAALVVGVAVSNLFSFGHAGASLLKLSMSFGTRVQGSGNVVVEKRSVTGFTSVETGGIYQVTIVAQKDFGVQVEADDNLLPLIKTDVRNGVLQIESEKQFQSSNPVRIRISAPDIESVDISGVADVTLSDLHNSGLKVEASGASKVTVTGETTDVSVDVSGAAKIFADGLQAESATIDASGASHVAVKVSNEIRSDISGASKVVYSGTPRSVVTHRSGAGSISAK